MKIVVTAADDNGLKAKLDSRFGRASYFAFVDTKDDSVEFIKNDAKNASSGAGVQAAQTVADTGADVLISGNIGPKAFDGLSRTDLEIYSGPEESIQKVIDEYQLGNLEQLESATKSAHAGLN
ncbi:NifB/NifX family molybdenum-iron cluster-binding protein [Halanaerobacter jeridensis]|uniref:Fe-Mo cluster-binding NifX family protein n=1 Tax=Halanaerobacter jeridensis TaxID=706427 RepID=A0A939BQJ4_9FIRM|nr:NifB/NifX family molybdenum-iron cluster-binding protein [Halanaerobacter jeridensis]MBM7556389.1 putative Fe-Mo cluster-binding NifX family protein [Halanaerobacter jeridensis]